MVTEAVCRAVGSRLSAESGLSLVVSYGSFQEYRGWFLSYQDQLDEGVGFDILLSATHHHAEAIFRASTFAGPLLRVISNRLHQSAAGWSAELDRSAERKIQTVVSVNGELLADPWSLPNDPIRDLEIETLVRVSGANDSHLVDAIAEAAAACLTLILSCLDLQSTVPDGSDLLPEGSATTVRVNRYERNPIARMRCIEAYGSTCWVCDMDFGASYGELGAGFVEVHHRVPVSMMGVGYLVDPVREMVPLCSNCHSMAHRRTPPVDPTELREALGLPPKPPLPALLQSDQWHVDVMGVRVASVEGGPTGAGHLAFCARNETGTWVYVVGTKELWPCLEAAADGVACELDLLGGGIVPVKVRDELIEIKFGPLRVHGSEKEWIALIDDRLAGPLEEVPSGANQLAEQGEVLCAVVDLL